MKTVKKLFLLIAVIIPAIAFVACSKDDEPNIPDQVINVGQTYTIPVDGIWEPENEYVANIEGQTVKGLCAGETTIWNTQNGKQSFKVTVKPTSFLYKDPCLQFGANKSKVKGFMTGFVEVDTENESLNFYYEERGFPIMYIYMFENNGLKSTGVFLPAKMTTSKQLADYLKERYIPVGSNGELIAMISTDKKIAVGVTVEYISSVLMYEIVYLPYSSTKSNQDDIIKFIEDNVIRSGETFCDGIDDTYFFN